MVLFKSLSSTLSRTRINLHCLKSHFLSSTKVLLKTTTSSNYTTRSQLIDYLKNNTKLYGTMAPTGNEKEAEILQKIDEFVKNNRVMIFSKSYCPYCQKVKGLFHSIQVEYFAYELDQIDANDGKLYQDMLKRKTGMSTVPSVFVNGHHIGGCDDTFKSHQQGRLLSLLNHMEGQKDDGKKYDYDLIVIGGGSGGLAAAKEAAKLLGKGRVALCDFVKPTPIGTSWGLGGTCVNVGCIPKKLMHQASLLGQSIRDAESFGWNVSTEPYTIDWEKMVNSIQDHIASLNWGYRVALRSADVTYFNSYAEFSDEHTVKMTNKKGKVENATAKNIIVSTGGRPKYPNIPGAREYGISSDDLFSLPYNPGKTLLIGASYIALECGGFLAGLGIDTSIMVRSILLRGFDREVSEMIGENLADHGVRFFKGFVPTSIEKIADGNPPRLLVKAKETDGTETIEEEFNTVIFAVGRHPITSDLNLPTAKVSISKGTDKILTNEAEQTNVDNIYAIGDVAENRPELTPTAIEAGVLLARRLFGGKTTLCDYENVPTTVFTPLEYGCVGLSEELAIERYGLDNIEVYHTFFQPLEFTVPKREENKCYAKIICVKPKEEKVVGFHYLGPNAGEITQGFAMGIRLGAKREDFDSLIGIHPTCAEVSLNLNKPKLKIIGNINVKAKL